MHRYNARKIAKIAYRQIKSVIDKWEAENDCQFGIKAHWDGCISINEFCFAERELKDYEEDVE